MTCARVARKEFPVPYSEILLLVLSQLEPTLLISLQLTASSHDNCKAKDCGRCRPEGV